MPDRSDVAPSAELPHPSRLATIGRRLAPRTVWRATVWYVALTVALTWPIAADLTHTVPSDLGDPLLNCWIIGWNAEQYWRALSGDPSALANIWHANIFHPERYTLGFSELLFAQAATVLPVYALTGNVILCYNLAFLSAYAMSGLGMFVLVRELTGDWRAGFVAGTVYGFLPYRVDQAPHIQSMTSQWMPFVFYGLRRYFETNRPMALAGATTALVAQNLSCGYFLVYFSLFVPVYALYEMAARRELGRSRRWVALGLAAAVAGAVTLVSMRPYFALRETHDTRRSLEEVVFFSADVYAYVNAPGALTLWGERMKIFDRPEGALFAGFTSLALAVVGLGGAGLSLLRQASAGVGTATARQEAVPLSSRLRRMLAWSAVLAAITYATASVIVLANGPTRFRVLGTIVRMTSVRRLLWGLGVSLAVLLWASPRARSVALSPFTALKRGLAGPAFFATCMVAAWAMSLGPRVKTMGVTIGPGPYGFFYQHVPGFDGLRVPARFAMVAFFFMAIVAGYGFASLARRWPGRAGTMAAVTTLIVLVESAALPFPVNGPMHAGGEFDHPPFEVEPAATAPAVYRELAKLPEGTVVLELPFGDIAWDIRATFHSTVHWHPILNGFSGYFPDSYLERAAVLRQPDRRPGLAWQAIMDSAATHVVVHGRAFRREVPPPDDWLLSHGAKQLGVFGDDRLYVLPR